MIIKYVFLQHLVQQFMQELNLKDKIKVEQNILSALKLLYADMAFPHKCKDLLYVLDFRNNALNFFHFCEVCILNFVLFISFLFIY